MGEMDVTFRNLLRDQPQPILRLAFPRRRLEPLGPVDPSVDRPRQRTADSLFRVRDASGEAAVHVEIERAWRVEIPHRLFEYASGAVVSTRLPVWSVVVLLRPGGTPPDTIGVYRIPGADGDAFVFRYHVVSLWQLDAHRMREQLGLESAPFCVAMQGADEAFIRELVDDVQSDRSVTEDERRTTIQLLYLVSAAILGSSTAQRIFDMDWLMQDPNVRELIDGWEAKGEARGREQGLELGREQGLELGRAGTRAALHRLLAARSFSVTPDLRARIDGEADVTRLGLWLVAAVTAVSIDDVFRDG